MPDPDLPALPSEMDMALTIHNQARIRPRSSPIDEIQIAHVMWIGYRAGVAAGRAQAAAQLDAEAARMRREDFRSGKVGIEYINGWEDASERVDQGAVPDA